MGKSHLEMVLQETLQTNKKICIPYIMAGDGGLDILEERLLFLKDCGATAVELGIPFSDPVADGPTIQQAGIRALKEGASLSAILRKLASFQQPHPLPIILMTYINPILAIGLEEFTGACQTAGVDGVIIPDLPMEEEDLIANAFTNADIAFIRLVALTSPLERSVTLANLSDGFLYAVTVNGTTGGRTSHQLHEVGPYLQKLKSISPVPVLAGFGISSPGQAKQLGSFGDGVIIGSKIIQLLQENKYDEISTLIASVS
ncbi:tryptophan synthase subunit alpha [Virgibacillus sp. 179-BFC.A HS]|uniref:Tryptophan synthase alpha chain n=1 Tax=Tigheibacillus jepli TaxID=3035914 RepID=A0ABU5CMD6_9BACI|nr:tryptophan synthase subunit alpha [Virgibacillus sp. 179-BFC.A HS]MDY0406992.1 tryptophan synthase subunit alpha [Virgibacillus sp. 179-BFC.A HS]